jgi:aldehyde:ferredoxin oxidoreductase
MDLENIYVGKILCVDLEEGTCEEEDLEEDLIEERIGGAAVNLALYRRYMDRDPVILGSGPLTGTFAPSGCAGVVTGRSPVTGRVCHVPLLLQTAVEMKYSGFDFVVILGKSEKPVRVWLHDELAEIAGADGLWGKDVWGATDWLRHEHGDDYVHALLIGPAGENGSSLAQLSEDYWGSRDIFGLGALWGAKKLKAVAMRGMGGLEVADGFFQDCVEAQREIRNGAFYRGKGMGPILASLGAEAGALETLMKRVHRSVASTHCAYAPYSFVMTEEPPDLMKESRKEEPGLLLTDPAGILSLLFLQEGLPAVLRRIQRLGLEPNACGALLRREGITDPVAAEARIRELAAGSGDPGSAGGETVCGVAPWPLAGAELLQAACLFSHALPVRPVGGPPAEFSVPEDGPGKARWWLERMAACSILGVCSLSVLLSPVFSLERMSQWASRAAGWEGLDGEVLLGKCRALIAETISLGSSGGSVPDGGVSADGESFLKSLEQG